MLRIDATVEQSFEMAERITKEFMPNFTQLKNLQSIWPRQIWLPSKY
jgi:hypothetical protein